MLVEALVAKLAVEAFHEAILLRLAWRDVVPFDAVLLGPRLAQRLDGLRSVGGVVCPDDELGRCRAGAAAGRG